MGSELCAPVMFAPRANGSTRPTVVTVLGTGVSSSTTESNYTISLGPAVSFLWLYVSIKPFNRLLHSYCMNTQSGLSLAVLSSGRQVNGVNAITAFPFQNPNDLKTKLLRLLPFIPFWLWSIGFYLNSVLQMINIQPISKSQGREQRMMFSFETLKPNGIFFQRNTRI